MLYYEQSFRQCQIIKLFTESDPCTSIFFRMHTSIIRHSGFIVSVLDPSIEALRQCAKFSGKIFNCKLDS